ncbi:helix-turn-helix transcriptional regulator [Sphingobacterium hungaricum]
MLVIIVILSFAELSAQGMLLQPTEKQKVRFETALKNEKNFEKDTTALRNYLKSLISYSKQYKDPSLLVAYHSLLGNGFSSFYDRLNRQSADHYLQAIDLAKRNKLKEIHAWTLINYAYYLYSYRQTTLALPVFLEAAEALNQISPENMVFKDEAYKRMGYFFGTIGDNSEAINYLEIAQKYAEPKSSQLAAIHDNIGAYYLENKDTVHAVEYFERARAIAVEIKDYLRLGKVLGNLALVHEGRGEIDRALALVEQDLAYSERYSSDNNTMFAQIIQARLLVKKNRLADAKKVLLKAEEFAESKDYLLRYVKKIEEIKLQIAIKTQSSEEELHARRKISLLNDSLTHLDGDEVLQQTKWLADKEKYNHSLELINQKYNREQSLKRAYAIVVILLILIVLYAVLNFKRKMKIRQHRYEKKVLQFQLDKIKSDVKLAEKSDKILSYKTYLSEKNTQIDELNKSIEQIKSSSSFYIEEQKGELNALLTSHLMTDENWISFKRAFEKGYASFYHSLLKNYPDLTESNLRMIILTKLGLSSKEISNLLGITADAIKKSRQRLKKKMGEKWDSVVEPFHPEAEGKI